MKISHTGAISNSHERVSLVLDAQCIDRYDQLMKTWLLVEKEKSVLSLLYVTIDVSESICLILMYAGHFPVIAAVLGTWTTDCQL